MQFIPDEDKTGHVADDIEIPFLEDARADFAPFYASDKSIKQATAEIEKEMAKLGGVITSITQGKFNDGGKSRIGYLIEFRLYGMKGQIPVAALPIRTPTEKKEEQAKVQALLNVAQWIRSMVTKRVFSPGANPLIPYLTASNGKPIIEIIFSQGLLQSGENKNKD